MRVCPQQEKGRVRLAEEELEASAPAPLVHFHLETRARMTHDGCFSLLLLALCSLSLRVGVQAFSLDGTVPCPSFPKVSLGQGLTFSLPLLVPRFRLQFRCSRLCTRRRVRTSAAR
jgi:hypothetical protein